ncbi:lysine-sensitive aspartokinase 3 [Vibrio zhugei]|nr:lysine-sensitive aspartokinase 3 [Vibrio zhugei]
MSTFNVAKFGGTSVADFTAMNRCAAIIERNPQTKLVVSSACSGVTNLLVTLSSGIENPQERASLIGQIAAIHQTIIEQLNDPSSVEEHLLHFIDVITSASEAAAYQTSHKLTDHLVSCGELMSTHLLTQILRERGLDAVRFDIRHVLRTDDNFGKAEPQLETIRDLASEHLTTLCEQHIVVTQGFIGSDSQGNTTTLGRGGSDYSAALIAESVNASGLEIWTDVPGIYSTDPRIAPNASPIGEISFNEASEMANFGAKILHPSTLLPALRQGIPVFVGSSKAPEQGGTWIRKQVESAPQFRALALRDNQTMVTLHSEKMFQSYGFLAKVFEILAKHKLSIDLITTSEISVSLTLDKTDTSGGAPELPAAVQEELQSLCSVKVEHDLSLIALIGNHMDNQGYAKKVFGALDDFNVRMICYGASEHNLCFLVDSSSAKQAIQHLHEQLFE